MRRAQDKRRLRRPGWLALVAAILIAAPVAGQAWPGHAPQLQPPQVLPASERMSLNQATRMVQRESGGRVLSAEEVQRGNRTIYRIRVLVAEGRVRVVEVDLDSGRMR